MPKLHSYKNLNQIRQFFPASNFGGAHPFHPSLECLRVHHYSCSMHPKVPGVTGVVRTGKNMAAGNAKSHRHKGRETE